MSKPTRALVFGLLTAACVVAGAIYVVVAASRDERGASGPGRAVATSTLRGGLLYRDIGEPDSSTYGQLAVTKVDASGAARRGTGLACDRIAYTANRGMCLHSTGASTFVAKILDERLVPIKTVRLAGIPSRVRISADGRYASVTAFVTGHSYAQGNFSTQTVIVDLIAAKALVNVERFDIRDGDKRLDRPDLNIWGTTFTADVDHFYATAGTGGERYLFEGSIGGRSGKVIHKDVECPSLSPNGKLIAYKKSIRKGDWRLHVLELASNRDWPLAETRNVDDQVEWLDDGSVLYGVDDSVWKARADGSGRPQRLVAGAESPAVVR